MANPAETDRIAAEFFTNGEDAVMKLKRIFIECMNDVGVPED